MPATPQNTIDRMNLEMPVTHAHRQAAFTAMHWRGWTFEAAQKVDLRRRLIEARAHQIRTKEWLATQRAHRGTAQTLQPRDQAALNQPHE